jgi:hypothetical protein
MHVGPGQMTGRHVADLRVLPWPDSGKESSFRAEPRGGCVGSWRKEERMQGRRFSRGASRLAHESPQVGTRAHMRIPGRREAFGTTPWTALRLRQGFGPDSSADVCERQVLTAKERCMGSWDGDNWVHILCPLVAALGIPHAPHDVGPRRGRGPSSRPPRALCPGASGRRGSGPHCRAVCPSGWELAAPVGAAVVRRQQVPPAGGHLDWAGTAQDSPASPSGMQPTPVSATCSRQAWYCRIQVRTADILSIMKGKQRTQRSHPHPGVRR